MKFCQRHGMVCHPCSYCEEQDSQDRDIAIARHPNNTGHHMFSWSAREAAERMVNSKIGWSGERGDVVCDVDGGRYVVAEGYGNPHTAFEQVKYLRERLIDLIADELVNFGWPPPEDYFDDQRNYPPKVA